MTVIIEMNYLLDPFFSPKHNKLIDHFMAVSVNNGRKFSIIMLVVLWLFRSPIKTCNTVYSNLTIQYQQIPNM